MNEGCELALRLNATLDALARAYLAPWAENGVALRLVDEVHGRTGRRPPPKMPVSFCASACRRRTCTGPTTATRGGAGTCL